jgi:adenine-specific DNA-methyltransferase
MASVAQIDLFEPRRLPQLQTVGVKYAGSKGRLLNHIIAEISQQAGQIVLDGFAGTTRVSQALGQLGRTVVTSDRSALSRVFAQCFLQFRHDQLSQIVEQLDYLNNLAPQHGWFSENYGGRDENGRSVGLDGLKKPWMLHNTQKLDAIRPAIDAIATNELNKSVLLASLILALDRVDSTLGHHVSYLDRWAARAHGMLKLVCPQPVNKEGDEHRSYEEDIFSTLARDTFDICYFDPPYGSNNEKMPPSRVRYDSYYHLWKTVILNDRPQLFGKACRREDSRDGANPSPFESYERDADGKFVATNQISKLLRKADAPVIYLSYSSGGRATRDCLMDAISSAGSLRKMIEIDYRRNVMADMAWTRDWLRDNDEPNKEFLFAITK